MLTRLAFGSACLSTPLLDRCRTLHAQREAALEAGSVAGSTSTINSPAASPSVRHHLSPARSQDQPYSCIIEDRALCYEW
jgi:hypothetical protein